MNKYDGIKKAEAEIYPRTAAPLKKKVKNVKKAGIIWRYVFVGLALSALFCVKAIAPDAKIIAGVRAAVSYDLEEDIDEAIARLLNK